VSWCGNIGALQVFASDDFREACAPRDRQGSQSKMVATSRRGRDPAMSAPYFAEIGTEELKFS